MEGNSNRQGLLKVGLTFAGLLVAAMVMGSSISGGSELSLATLFSSLRFDRYGILVALILLWGVMLFFSDRRMQRQVDSARDYAQQAIRLVEDMEAKAQGIRSDNYSKAMEQLADTNSQMQVVGVYALERVMQDDPEAYWRSGIEELCALVRRTSAMGTVSGKSRVSGVPGPEWVCQVALFVLGRRDVDKRSYDPPIFNLRSAELSGSDLSQCDLSKMDLSEAKFGGADLSGAKFCHSNLRRANLSWVKFRMADLSGAKLSEANCSRSNFFRANLSESELDGADLSGVDLWRANLRRANLTGAKLRNTNLSGVDLQGADLSDADLVGARGLTLAQLLGASSFSNIKLDDELKTQLDDHRCRPASAILSSIEQKADSELSYDRGDTLPTVPATPSLESRQVFDVREERGKAESVDLRLETCPSKENAPVDGEAWEENTEVGTSEAENRATNVERKTRTSAMKDASTGDAKGQINSDYKPSPPAA